MAVSLTVIAAAGLNLVTRRSADQMAIFAFIYTNKGKLNEPICSYKNIWLVIYSSHKATIIQ